MMPEELRNTGIDVLGNAPWGTHFCQFYETAEDLVEILVPYFKAGLENNEFCMWICSEPLDAQEARKALDAAVPDLDRRLKEGQIEILPHDEWYLQDGTFDSQRVLDGWAEKLNGALAAGYEGLRLTGNTDCIKRKDWPGFTAYEEQVNNVIGKHCMLALCSFALGECKAAEIIDVISNHRFALVRRHGKWQKIEDPDRRQAAEAQRLHDEIAANMSEGVYLVRTSDVVIAYANPRFEEMFGYEPGEMVGKHASIVNAPTEKSPEETAREIMAFIAAHGYWRGEIHNIKKDGTPFWCHASVSVFDHPVHGNVVVAVHTDITERKRAEEALREAARFNEQIILSAQNGVIVYGPDLKYQVWNPFMEQLTGLAAGDVLGKHPLELFPFLQETGVMERLAKALAGETPETIEFPYDFQEVGRKGWASDTSGPLRGTNGEIIGVIGAVRDITERKQAEERLRQSQKLEAIGLLAGGVAHDFRNQLMVIQGYGERLFRSSVVSGDERRAAEEILKAAERSTTLTGQLLAFSRQEMLRPEVIDLDKLVSDMGRTLPRMIGEDIRLSVASCCPACHVSLDANQLQQAILNLVVNARHAMPDGGELVIGTSCFEADASFCQRHDDVEPGPYVVLSVTDTGCGMDAETLERVFDPFFTTKDVDQGTGMGLAMVYGFARQSDGAIEADSEPGKGSTFRLYFPCVEAPAAARSGIEAPQEIPGGTETILVVEDEEAVRGLLTKILRRSGYTVIEAGNAAEALPLAQNHKGPIDALVTDIVMPGMSGVQLAERVRQSRPGIAVLYMTAYEGADLLRRGVVGVDMENLLIKPFSPAEVAHCMRRAIASAPRPADP